MDPIRCPHARKAAPVTSTLTLNFLERKRCVEHIRKKMMECEEKVVNDSECDLRSNQVCDTGSPSSARVSQKLLSHSQLELSSLLCHSTPNTSNLKTKELKNC